MRVKDLIFELKHLNQDLEVYFDLTENSPYDYEIVEWASETEIEIDGQSEKEKVVLLKYNWPD